MDINHSNGYNLDIYNSKNELKNKVAVKYNYLELIDIGFFEAPKEDGEWKLYQMNFKISLK